MWGKNNADGLSRWARAGIAVLAITGSSLTGCTRLASGSPVDDLISVDPQAILLDGPGVDAALGTRGAQVVDQANAPDDTVDSNPPECHGLIYIAGVIEYAPTGFTALGWRIVRAEGPVGVVQMVAQLPSVAAADEFIGAQTKMWKACEGKTITITDKASKETGSPSLVSAVRPGPHMVLAELDDGTGSCQHVLQAVANIILDVDVCGSNVPDPAVAVAQKLAERVRPSA